MPRPALSASRSIDVIEFLALFPQRRFTLSQIAQATAINIASAHAVLMRLCDRGYVLRFADKKTYGLGPSLIAVGQAGLESQPIVYRAKRAAERLQSELGTAVLLCTVIADEILAVISLRDAQQRTAGMLAGERLPLVAPIGAPFLAWATPSAIEAWIARRTCTPDATIVQTWHRDLLLTRQRGYQVLLRPANGPSIASLMEEMANGQRNLDYRGELTKLINSMDPLATQPDRIERDADYDVLQIAAPLFDADGAAAFNLCLGGFAQRLTGGELMQYGERLTRTCLDIMRPDWTLQPQQRSAP